MEIKTAPLPKSNMDYNDPEQVAALLQRVRTHPMRIRHVTRGVPRYVDPPRPTARRFFGWFSSGSQAKKPS